MPKKIWDMGVGRAVESSPGVKTSGDYSGLHKRESALEQPVQNLYRGAEAQRQLRASIRRKLNEGEDFAGFLTSRIVDHVTLYIGVHPIHGLSAYADRVTTHSNGMIEVIVSDATAPVILTRDEYFGRLLEDEIPDALIAEFCQRHWHA